MKHAGSYTFLSEKEWDERIAAAEALAAPCVLCPRNCKVDRAKGQKGFCRAAGELVIASIFPHHGEEPPISGTKGSGTVFFSYCSLRCCFCQNHQISHEGEGEPYTTARLAERMLHLQSLGVHNINLVTPTHFLPWILIALREAARQGLSLPIVWNSSGYESASALKLLKGVVDIFLPDMKYGDDGPAEEYSTAPDYVAVNREAVREMFRQTGPLLVDEEGIAYRGVCIRHLVLPRSRAGSSAVFAFLESAFDPADVSISLMAQYRPLYRAAKHTELCRVITQQEYDEARQECVQKGFNGYYQELSKLDEKFCIDFKRRKNEPLTGT
jgi:putative pyruvate formate lyase activating enzyme